MICKQFDVVTVPFPFSDLPQSKKRKALVISNEHFNRSNKTTILLMITSALHSKWVYDIKISDLTGAGLNKDCVVRMKCFTLDNGLLMERCGHLGKKDASKVIESLQSTLAIKF